MTHEVQLDVFEGPIDLLLHLVTKQRVDIYDVPLATITDDYLKALGSLENLDLEAATGFLVVAATLLELKSARLLPTGDGEERDSLLEERDRLLARLVECSTFREAGAAIGAGLEKGGSFYGRTAGLEPQYIDLAPDLLARVTLSDVARSAAAALYRPQPPVLDVSHVAPIRASVADAVIDLARGLEAGPRRSFEELCERTRDRIEVVVRFLALLELFKAGAIDLTQAERFGVIEVEWTGEVDPLDVVAGLDEYALQEKAS